MRALIAAEDPSLKGKDKEMGKDLQWKMLVQSMRLEEEILRGLGVLCPSPSIFRRITSQRRIFYVDTCATHEASAPQVANRVVCL